MDALRKAEESKRQAAQKQKEEQQHEVEIITSEPSAAEDLQALEESLEFDREMTAHMAMPEEPQIASSGLADVEVPFEFEIDENFGQEVPETKIEETVKSQSKADPDSDSDAQVESLIAAVETPVETTAKKETKTKSKSKRRSKSKSKPEPDAGVEEVLEARTDELDYIKPDELSRFTASSGSSTEELLEPEVAPEAGNFGLTLEDRAPDIERPSIIGSELETTPAPEPDQAPVSAQEPAQEVEQEVELAIRAQRDDLHENDVVETANSAVVAPNPAKTATPKFKEESRKRESARAVFNAKHKRKASGSRKKLIAAAAIIALFPLAGGGYLLLESMGIFSTGNQYSIPPDFNASVSPYVDPVETVIDQESLLPDLSPEPFVADAIIQDLEITEVSSTDSVAEDVSAPVQVENESVAVLEPVVIPPAPAESAPSVASVQAALEDSSPSQSDNAALEEVVTAPAAINITRTDNAELVDPQLTQAYASYRASDFIGARARYQQVLRDKPNNRDAMLGLAAVAMQLSDAASARETYVKLLELDPRDVHARVGLLETMPASDPVMLESELRALFAAHPEVAQLAFALGNHFASQRRWSDAQQSYYDALLAAKAGGGGPISPDYAFNLAVSLERLNQLRPAYTFYREALEQSKLTSPGFDIRVLRERLDALERVLP